MRTALAGVDGSFLIGPWTSRLEVPKFLSSIAQLGQVQCSATPQGTCTIKKGRVLCFDPPQSEILFQASSGTGVMPASSCLENNGRVACGYQCIASNEDVGCA